MRLSNIHSSTHTTKTHIKLLSVIFTFFTAFVLMIFSSIITSAAYVEYTGYQGNWDGDPIFFDMTTTYETDFSEYNGTMGANMTITANTSAVVDDTRIDITGYDPLNDDPVFFENAELVTVLNETAEGGNEVLYFYNTSSLDDAATTIITYRISHSNNTYPSCMEFDFYYDNTTTSSYVAIYFSPFGYYLIGQTRSANSTDYGEIYIALLPNGSVNIADSGVWLVDIVGQTGWYHIAFGYARTTHESFAEEPWTGTIDEKYVFFIIPNGTTHSYLDTIENMTLPTQNLDASICMVAQLNGATDDSLKVYFDNFVFYDGNASYWDVINSTKSLNKMMSILIVPLLVMIPLIALFETVGKK